jgi:hypothetical protein
MAEPTVKNVIPDLPDCSYSKWRLKYFQRENWLAAVLYYQKPISVSTDGNKSPKC